MPEADELVLSIGAGRRVSGVGWEGKGVRGLEVPWFYHYCLREIRVGSVRGIETPVDTIAGILYQRVQTRRKSIRGIQCTWSC